MAEAICNGPGSPSREAVIRFIASWNHGHRRAIGRWLMISAALFVFVSFVIGGVVRDAYCIRESDRLDGGKRSQAQQECTQSFALGLLLPEVALAVAILHFLFQYGARGILAWQRPKRARKLQVAHDLDLERLDLSARERELAMAAQDRTHAGDHRHAAAFLTSIFVFSILLAAWSLFVLFLFTGALLRGELRGGENAFVYGHVPGLVLWIPVHRLRRWNQKVTAELTRDEIERLSSMVSRDTPTYAAAQLLGCF